MQIGTGWLGWTEKQTLETAIPTIELAYEGLTEKLWLIQEQRFADPKKPQPLREKPAPSDIFAVFRQAGAPKGGLSK